jgi:hypothetical protein
MDSVFYLLEKMGLKSYVLQAKGADNYFSKTNSIPSSNEIIAVPRCSRFL